MTTNHAMNGSAVALPPGEEEVNLRAYWRVLVRRRALILRLVVIVTVGTAGLMLLLPNMYQSTATLMPLAPSRGGGLPTATPGELGGFLPSGSGGGVGSLLGKEKPTDRLLAILHSRTVAMEVVQSLDLIPMLFAKKWQWLTDKPPTLQDAVRKLDALVSLTDNRQNVITIAVSHTDPVMAATIANQYIEALQHALNDNAFSIAKKNRIFIAAQLESTRKDLAVADEMLKQFEQTHKIAALEAQTASAVKAIADVEAQIRQKEVQIGVSQRLMTGASREVYLAQEELRELRAQLAQLHRGEPELAQAKAGPRLENQIHPSLAEAPEIKLQYVRLEREVIVQNKLFTLLAQQLEQAKIDEARDETAFQVLDRAIPPERKSKPARTVMVLLSMLVSLCAGVMLALVRESMDPTVRTKEQVERQVGLALLVTMPAVEAARRRRYWRSLSLQIDPPVASSLDTPATQALRYLHTRLKCLKSERPIQTVLLVAPEPGDTTATLLVDLAMVAASTGERTLLIDSNIPQPSLHSLLGCALTPGLADVLATPDIWYQSIQSTQVDNLHIVAAGTVTPTTAAALESSLFETLLASYKKDYDLILCAAPPVLRCTDAAVLGSKVDATCLVLTSGVSRLETIVEAKNVLEDVQANVIGAVLMSRKA
jgi:capsular exopolysaccharide synthesis family protein